jgi:hypothetical protein
VGVPPARVFEVLADFERYPGWCPGIAATRLLAREGDVAIVEIRAASGAPPLVLEMVATRDASMMFTQVDRERRRGLSGQFDIEPSPPSGARVRGQVSFGAALPRPGQRRRLRSALTRLLAALAERVGPAEPAEAGAEVLLEIVRTAEGLEARVAGERLRFPAPRP